MNGDGNVIEMMKQPESLSFIPDKSNPYVVNLLFKEPVGKLDDNAFISLLLCLVFEIIITIKRVMGKTLEMEIDFSKTPKKFYQKCSLPYLLFL